MSVCYDYKTKHYYIDAKILLKNGKYKHVSYRENFNDNFKSKKYVASIEYKVIEELKAKANREFAIDSLDDLFDRWYKSIENEKSIESMLNYTSRYKTKIKPFFIYMNDLFDVSKLNKFRIYIAKTNLNNELKNAILGLTRNLIIYARRLKIIDSDTKDDCLFELENIKEKVQIKKASRNKYTSLEDFKKIITEINSQNDKALLTLLYFSGLRIGEFLGIKVGDISFDNDVATISISRQKLKCGVVTDRLKTNASYKKIAYVGENALILKDYIERNKLQENDFLFPFSRNTIHRRVINYSSKAGVMVNTLHGFGRKSINTELYLHGADAKVRKTLLGQASEIVNEQKYTDDEVAFNKGVEILKSLN